MESGESAPLTQERARTLIAAAWQDLERQKQTVNDLNVYPVPDGDTGTNLSLTVRGVLDDLTALPVDATPAEVAQTIGNGALMSARGNSGVILSQIVRGAMEVLGVAETLTPAVAAEALVRSTEVAYRAVRRPVEGTMLTVLREMGEAAAALVQGGAQEGHEGAETSPPDAGAAREDGIEPTPPDASVTAGVSPIGWEPFAERVVAAGWESVRRTPTLLKVLADAGVVDAGGFGLMVLVEAVLGGGEVIAGRPSGSDRAAPLVPTPSSRLPTPAPGGLTSEAQTGPVFPDLVGEYDTSRYTYCTSFLLSGQGLEVQAFEEKLAPLGDSLLVVGGGESLKVHIHTDHPGVVLGLATERGVLSKVEIDNMREQTAERAKRLAARQEEGPTADAGTAAAGEVAGASSNGAGELTPGTLTQVVAVVAGQGNRDLFRSLGASVLIDGGQTMNPSAEEILAGVRRTAAHSVVILPNNKNIILAAEQVAHLTDRDVLVLPTRSLQAGLTALVSFDATVSGEENVARMEEAVSGLRTAEVTRAVRDSRLDGLSIREGDYLGLVDGQVVIAARDLARVVEEVADRLVDPGKEVLTVLLGDDGRAEAEACVALLQERYPDLEVEVYEGGQPHYPLLLSAE